MYAGRAFLIPLAYMPQSVRIITGFGYLLPSLSKVESLAEEFRIQLPPKRWHPLITVIEASGLSQIYRYAVCTDSLCAYRDDTLFSDIREQPYLEGFNGPRFWKISDEHQISHWKSQALDFSREHGLPEPEDEEFGFLSISTFDHI